tara:strand:- start:218 stop:487 length:270 start_codon:yes stop_codon:yes gene_type:complete
MKRTTQTERVLVKRLHRQGKTIKQIADRLGRHPDTIANIVNPKRLEKRRLVKARFDERNPDYYKTDAVKKQNRESALRCYYQNKEVNEE